MRLAVISLATMQGLGKGARFGLAPEAVAEHGLQGDLQRDIGHILRKVEFLAADGIPVPGLDVPLDDLDHGARHGRDAATVERRLHEFALARPQLVLADEQALAENRLELVHHLGLAVVAVIGLKHVFDVLRMVEKIGSAHEYSHWNEVAVGLRDVAEKTQSIGAQVRQHTEDRITLRPFQRTFSRGNRGLTAHRHS